MEEPIYGMSMEALRAAVLRHHWLKLGNEQLTEAYAPQEPTKEEFIAALKKAEGKVKFYPSAD